MNKLKKLYLLLSLLLIISGTSIFFILNLFEIFGSRDLTLKTSDNYSVDYPQGSGNLEIDIKLTYERDHNFLSENNYITTASGDVEEIGITYYELYVYVNEGIRKIMHLNLIEPSTNYYHSFGVSFLYKNDVVAYRGYIDLQFNVNDVIQNETISFDLSMTIPLDTGTILYDIYLTLIWIEAFLVVGLGVTIFYVVRTIKMIRRERILTEDERRRDEDFFEFIKEKSKKPKD